MHTLVHRTRRWTTGRQGTSVGVECTSAFLPHNQTSSRGNRMNTNRSAHNGELGCAAARAPVPNVDLESSKLSATRGQEAQRALALQVVSSHLLGVLDIESALSTQPALGDRLLPHAASEADAVKRPNFPRQFLLDGCSLTFLLEPLSGRLRTNSPGRSRSRH
jgi:hypothetical protein